MKIHRIGSLLLFLLAAIIFLPKSYAQPRYRGIIVNPSITASDIEVLKTWKVNVVRYQLVWSDRDALDTSTIETYRAWLEQSLNTFEAILPSFEAANIKVILNLHSPPGGFLRRDKLATHRLFTETWTQPEWLRTWEVIATRFKGRAGILAFDMQNEPANAFKTPEGLRDWNGLATAGIELIRSIDPNTTIFMTPLYGQLKRFNSMKAFPGQNVEYNVHFYDPWTFTHQGLSNPKERILYPTPAKGKTWLENRFNGVKKFLKKNKGAKIHVGEFSVVRWAPKGSGARFLKDLTDIFEKYKFGYTYHSFREATVWNLELSENRNDETLTTKPSARLKVMLKKWRKNK